MDKVSICVLNKLIIVFLFLDKRTKMKDILQVFHLGS